MSYVDDIRDPILKINDDRKIQITLGGIKEPGTMIMLFVKDYDNRGKPAPKEGEFDRAWFRLSNEETNQTIDYSLVKGIEVPEDYQEVVPVEDEDADPALAPRNELTYLHGVLYLETHNGTNKWVFESFKDVFQSKDFPEPPERLAEVYSRSLAEFTEQQRHLTDAQHPLKKALEGTNIHA